MLSHSPSDFVLQPATPADAPLLVQLVRELADYERRLDEVVCQPADLAAVLGGAQPLVEAVIARRPDGEALAFALWLFKYSTFRGRPILYIEDLFVRPAHRRGGVGRQLLAYLARLALARGCAGLEWSVLTWNEPALEFYRGLGAEPVDEWAVYSLTGAPLAKLAQA